MDCMDREMNSQMINRGTNQGVVPRDVANEGTDKNVDKKGKITFQPKRSKKDDTNKRSREEEPLVCQIYSRRHPSECKSSQKIYFKFGQLRHFAKECLTRAEVTIVRPKQPTGRGQAKVYTITQAQTITNLFVMTGQLFFYIIPLYSLIDLGTTHSFVAQDCGKIMAKAYSSKPHQYQNA